MAVRKVQCPRCQAIIPLDQEFSGGRIICHQCSQKINIIITHRKSNSSSSSSIADSSTSLLGGTSDTTSGSTSQRKKTTVISVERAQTTQASNPKVPKSEDSDKRIATVTRQLGLNAADKADGDEFKIWKPGDLLLGGKYQVLELAPNLQYAEGGVGMVHRVHHLEWDIDFAVKSPKPAVVLSESGKQSFEKECKTWMDLGLHTNVVTCYFFRRIAGIPRVFAEYVADGTLKDWISSGRLYEGTQTDRLARILDIAIQFAWGLEHAHSKGLLHLDIKPGNVMMSGDIAKVTDFGLAKALDESLEHSKAGGIEGIPSRFCDGMTPSYCSPEQYDAFARYQNEETQTRTKKRSGKESSDCGRHPQLSADTSSLTGEDLITLSDPPQITKQSDIWSWAISILTMFHGRSPCKKGGQTAAEVFELFLKLPPTDARPAVPDGLIDILRHCFQKKPSDRPESMGVIADQLVKVYKKEIGPYPRVKPSDTASNAESLSNRAISMLDLGKTREAFTDIRKAVKMCSWHPQITFNSTMIDWRFGFISDLQALDRIEELTKHNTDDPYSFYALGLLQKERANPRGALLALNRAHELAPARPEFVKAIQSCNHAAPMESRCTGRFLLWSEKKELPAVYTDSSEEFYLVPASKEKIVLVHAASGFQLVEFKITNIESDDAKPVVAISIDYRRDLIRIDHKSLLLRNKGAESAEHQNKIQEILSTLPETIQFTRINWGKEHDALNGDGTLRLSIVGDTICQFDTATSEQILVMKGHKSDVTAVYAAPDGEYAATGSFDSSFKMWHLKSGRCLRTYRGLAGTVNAIWVDSRHRFVLTQVNETSLQFWNVDLLCNRKKLCTAPLMICMVSSSEEISKRHTELESLVEQIKQNIADQNYFEAVTAFNKAKTINGWQNIRTGLNFPALIGNRTEITGLDDAVSTVMFQAHDDAISSVALSYDGKTAVSCGKDHVLRLWRFPKGELVSEMNAHYDWVRSVDITIDGRFAVSGSWDKTIRVWDLKTGKMIRKMAEPVKNITQVRIAPDSSTIFSTSSWGEIIVWNGKTGEKINSVMTSEGHIHSFQISRDGVYLLTGGDCRMTLWNARTLTPVSYFEGFKSEITAVALSPDRKWGVGAEQEGEILLFDMESEWKQIPKRLPGHPGEVTSLLFLPDGRRLVSAGKDSTIRFWSIPNGKLERTLTGKLQGINALASDISQSTLLSGGEDAILRMWNLYWNYDYPGKIPSDDEMTRMLRVITAHHQRMEEIQSGRKSPADFYSPDKITPLPQLSLDNKTVVRILNEMAFRGFGNVSRFEMLSALRAVCK